MRCCSSRFPSPSRAAWSTSAGPPRGPTCRAGSSSPPNSRSNTTDTARCSPARRRLVYIGGTAPGSDLQGEFQLAPEFLIQYQEQSKLLQGVAPYDDFTNTLRVGDRAERVRMAVSTPSLFPTLGVTPAL